jgi:hypothetical protein
MFPWVRHCEASKKRKSAKEDEGGRPARQNAINPIKKTIDIFKFNQKFIDVDI